MVAKRDHHAPILARVSIGDRGDLGRSDRPAWIGEQRRVQRALDDARVRRRSQFRPRQIGLEKLVGYAAARRRHRGRADDARRRARNPACSHASTKDRPPSIPQHRNRDEVGHVDDRTAERFGQPCAPSARRSSQSRLRSDRAPRHGRSPIPASPSTSSCRLRPAASPTSWPRAGAAAHRGLGSTGRDREQAGRRHRPGRHRVVAKSAPDGYTLLVSADATFVTTPHLYSKLPYDPIKDFVPITGLGISPQALVVHPSVPVQHVRRADRSTPRKSRASSITAPSASASSGHLNIILLEGMTGTKFTPVHYRGAAPAITDLIGGHIQMMIVSIGLVRNRGRPARSSVLGFGSTARLGAISGRADASPRAGCRATRPGSWYGLAAPKGTPREIVAKLNARNADASSTTRLSRQVSRAELHLLDRELAGRVRRTHPARLGEMGQGHPRRQCKGGVKPLNLPCAHHSRGRRGSCAPPAPPRPPPRERRTPASACACRADARCGTPRGSRPPRRCGAPRSAYRAG